MCLDHDDEQGTYFRPERVLPFYYGCTPDKADDLLESLGEYVMTLGDTVDEDILTGLVADISEVWTPGYGGMSKKEARMAKKKFAEDEAARNEHVGAVDDLRRDGSKDAARMDDSETKG